MVFDEPCRNREDLESRLQVRFHTGESTEAYFLDLLQGTL